MEAKEKKVISSCCQNILETTKERLLLYLQTWVRKWDSAENNVEIDFNTRYFCVILVFYYRNRFKNEIYKNDLNKTLW